jgi:glycosyltransferase involved in cell wall biosynthesis
MKKLFIISNESIFNYDGNFFCDNIDLKSTPEGLSNKFQINIIGRLSKKIRSHKINIKNIKIYSNIFSYIYGVLSSFKEQDSKYLIISISPFTFIVSVLIKLLKKKPIVYLRSDGYGEYKVILGVFGQIMYHFMFSIISRISLLISCREYILRNKPGEIVAPSQISRQWLINRKEFEINKIKLLYVGRVRKEKGIYSLLSLIKEIKLDLTLSIVGSEKNSLDQIIQDNVHVYKVENNEKNLIKFYDDHNIFVLPSYTEGHPMVLLEALSRLRPVIIFKDIEHVVGNKKGIFIAERSSSSFLEKINYITKNYKNIQEEMKKNNLPTKEAFLLKLSDLILKSN